MPFPTDQLALQQEKVRVAHLRHSSGRSIGGRFENAYQLWRKYYEAKATLNDQNPAFAAKLLPKNAPLVGRVLGFFPIPAGVYWEVDKVVRGTVALTVDIAATVTVEVTPPDGSAKQNPVVTPTATRQSTTFSARVDGLYAVRIKAGTTTLTTLYVPVMRARFLDFRELSRYLAFDFKLGQNPPATDDYSEMLAVLYAADAAAATGQTALYAELEQTAAELNKAPKPVALFSHHA